MTTILRDWFLEGDGIRRPVISAEIQNFLGNDATVRPGKKVVDGREVDGYWIKAYRTFTSNMLVDLKEKSVRWDQEMQRSGNRVNYPDSRTFHESSTRYNAGIGSPTVDGPYQPPPPPPSRRPGYQADMPDGMDTTRDVREMYRPPMGPQSFPDPSRQPPVPYGQQGNYWAQNPAYPHEVGAFSSDRMDGQPPPGYYGRDEFGQPIPPPDDPRFPFRDDPRFPNRGDPRLAHVRDDPRYHQEMDDARFSDPRYLAGVQQGDNRYHPASRDDARFPAATFPDGSSRYAYPSPSTSTGSMPGHDPVSSPQQTASYGQAPAYDQYGRPASQQPSQLLEQSLTPTTRGETPFTATRERPSATSGNEPRRRRLQ